MEIADRREQEKYIKERCSRLSCLNVSFLSDSSPLLDFDSLMDFYELVDLYEFHSIVQEAFLELLARLGKVLCTEEDLTFVFILLQVRLFYNFTVPKASSCKLLFPTKGFVLSVWLHSESSYFGSLLLFKEV